MSKFKCACVLRTFMIYLTFHNLNSLTNFHGGVFPHAMHLVIFHSMSRPKNEETAGAVRSGHHPIRYQKLRHVLNRERDGFKDRTNNRWFEYSNLRFLRSRCSKESIALIAGRKSVHEAKFALFHLPNSWPTWGSRT